MTSKRRRLSQAYLGGVISGLILKAKTLFNRSCVYLNEDMAGGGGGGGGDQHENVFGTVHQNHVK